MNDPDDRLLREEGLAFFASIVAGQTHEITNVLNVINELAGLQEDLLSGEGRGSSPNGERLAQIAARIRKQVERGNAIVQNVNRFAHGADRPRADCDLRELLDGIVFLAQRSARLAKTSLEARLPDRSIPLETSPFALAHAVFSCIEVALAAATEQRRITVSCGASREGAEVVVESADPLPAGPELEAREAFLSLLVRDVGGRVTVAAGVGPDRITLFIPRREGEPR
jgi:C4-dicarboxylate-specific signal transduction histidine kinase